MVVKTVFFVSRGHLRRNNFLFHKFFKIFSCFQTLRKTFRIFGEKNLVGLSKLFSSVQGMFSEKFVFENKFLELFLYFWSSGAIFLDFRRNICDRFVKTAFYVSSGSFWLDWFFLRKFMSIFTVLGLWGKHCGILAQKLQKVYQKGNLCEKKFLWKSWFLKKLLQFFRVLIKIFATFDKSVE